jgi:universal stress protein E
MKRLLVIADKIEDSQQAVLTALDLAQKTGASIHVAIFEYELKAVLTAISVQNSDFSGADLKTQMINRKEQWWQEYIGIHQSAHEITHEIIWSKYIHAWVAKHTGKYRYDLMVKTVHPSEPPFYTPIDWQLFRDSTIPVYVVSHKHFKSQKIILVALDILARSGKKKNLNQQLLECANRLALQTDSALHCVFVIKVPTILKDLDLIDTRAFIDKAGNLAEPVATSLVQDYGIMPDRIHIEDGLPWGVVANLSKKLRAQCVVIGSMGRKGITGKLIGNTAEKIISIANTDLLVVSPEVRVI